MKLEYLIIFEDYGLPIFSECYGSFCATMGFDKNLFSGFLSALSSMSEMFGEGKGGLKSVELGYTNLNFTKILPSGRIVCVGLVKNSDDDQMDIENTLETFYDRINQIIEVDYKEKSWEGVSEEDIRELKHKMDYEAIIPTFPGFKNNEICDEGTCPFDHKPPQMNPKTNKPNNVVEQFENNYSIKQPLLKRIFAKYFIYIYRKIDILRHNRREKKVRAANKLN